MLNKEVVIYYLGDNGFEYSVIVFYNDFDDKIVVVFCEFENCLDDIDCYNINIDEVEFYGVELVVKYSVGNWFFNGVYSYMCLE